MRFLSDEDVAILKLVVADYKRRVGAKGKPPDLHRASDIVMVNVTAVIPARLGSPTEHTVTVWDVNEDASAGYTIQVTDRPNSIILPGKHFAALDRKGIWSIVHSSVRLLRFQLLGDFGTGIQNAVIKDMSGSTLFASAPLLDPELVLDELGIGDTGYCNLQDATFYAIQAPCPE